MGRIREVTCELEFPEKRNIHHPYHVSYIFQEVLPQVTISREIPAFDDEGQLVLVLKRILKNP